MGRHYSPMPLLFDITGDEPETFDSERASLGIPDDFSATNPTLFVGVSADGVGRCLRGSQGWR